MKTTIIEWNMDRGFGFAIVDGKRAFIHVSAISPSLYRGIDLKGQEIEVIGTEAGERGLKVVSANLMPISDDWFESGGSITHRARYLYGTSYLGNYQVVGQKDGLESIREPTFDEAQFESARMAGCPESTLQEAREYYQSKLEKWTEYELRTADMAQAIEAARTLLETTPEEFGVVIYPVETPQRTQWLNPECVEQFNTNWEGFVSSFVKVDENSHFVWAVVRCQFGETATVSGRHGYSYMEYRFQRGTSWRSKDSWRRRVFTGTLACGDSAPAHTED